jgi:SOS-response transcriptional repressor LexA
VHISELFSEATPGKASWVPLKENGEVKEMFPTKYPVSSKAFAIRVADDSLNPIIQPGDIVICDPEVRRQPKRFAAAVITDSNNHEEIVVRRLKAVEVDWKDLNATTFFFERDPVYLLVADNSFYPPIRTEEKDKSRFLGMIVERISNMLYIQC